jgi:hypothetical protein
MEAPGARIQATGWAGLQTGLNFEHSTSNIQHRTSALGRLQEKSRLNPRALGLQYWKLEVERWKFNPQNSNRKVARIPKSAGHQSSEQRSQDSQSLIT